jgi:UDP-N-acetylmuramoyl-tripeptide--D-alanyl-D-alanine ligase
VRFTLGELGASVGAAARTEAESGTVLSGVAVDSRHVRPGDLFVAIRGERVDGHAFALEAAARGAAALLGERRPADLPERFPAVLTPDPVRALQLLAASMKRAMGFRLAAITGSAGKTTTKDFAAAILARRFAIEKTPGNQNSQIGFAMSIVNLPRRPEWLVGEMGLSARGDLSRLSRTFEPDIAALLLVAPAHLQFFPSIDSIAEAKAEILEGLKTGGAFVANADDPRVEAIAEREEGRGRRVVRFGSSPSADVNASRVAAEAEASRFRLKMPSGEADIRLPLPGPHQVANFLAAAAIAFVVGLSPADCAEAAAELRPASHRGEWRRHASGARIYDDTYNANPASMRAALETLASLPAARRIAVLGDMLELGPEEERLHRETGRAAARSAQLLVAVGERGRWIAAGAVEAGLPQDAVTPAATAEEAAELLAGRLRAGDVVLLKASRGIGLDRTVEALSTAEAPVPPAGKATGPAGSTRS